MSRKLTTKEIVEKLERKYGDDYDYSKVEYIDANTKVCIICKKHGEVWFTPSKTAYNILPCKKCSIESRTNKRSLGKNKFIEKGNKIHGGKYDYSKVNYLNNRTKVCIVCPIHGEFWQTPDDHFTSFGCSLCANEHRAKSKTKDIFTIIKEFKKVHGDKYDYSKVKYEGAFKKVEIICPKHGVFLQSPDNHLHGKGCPFCNQSKLEETIHFLLNENGVAFEKQKKFTWLRSVKPMKLDFYLPKYNVAIECQGMQHFKPIDYFGGINAFQNNVKNDKLKKELCNEHDIKIFYYSNLGIEYTYEVFEDFNKMMDAIEKYNEEKIITN